MKATQTLRGIAVLGIAPILTFIVSVLALVDLLWVRRDPWKAQQFPRWWGRVICKLSGVSVRLEGLENLDPNATYVYAGNHASQFDIFAFQGYFPYDFRWMAKKELFRLPAFGRAMRIIGYIPVDRSNSREAMRSLDAAAARIAAGKSVLIFPEGTRPPGGLQGRGGFARHQGGRAGRAAGLQRVPPNPAQGQMAARFRRDRHPFRPAHRNPGLEEQGQAKAGG